MPKYIDIGANMVDTMFRGLYRGKQKHRDDLVDILSRAKLAGITGMLITAGNLSESVDAIQFCKEFSSPDLQLKCTVGVHPTRCLDFYKEKSSHKHTIETPEKYLEQLKNLILENPGVVAGLGECGLDNDRLHFCPIDEQKKGFARQIPLNLEMKIPMFLHDRAATNEFLEVLAGFGELKEFTGVVHSFTGGVTELNRILEETNFYIGINGCSLKTEENLTVAKQIPVDRLLLETDCPWCGIKNTHASKKYVKTEFETSKKFKDGCCVKDRTEPCHIVQVAEVMAALLKIGVEELSEIVYKNTVTLFPGFE